MTLSVVICTYNGQKFIGEQIESILNQTLLPNEIVVGDDGSTDDTLDVVESYRQNIESKGIKFFVFQNNHLGAHGNFKTTLPKATGDLIAPCDQDDIWLPEKLEKCAAAMTDDIDVVYCDEYILHEDGCLSNNNIAKPESVLDQLFGTHLAGHLLLFRRKLLDVYRIAPEITFDYGITIAAACTKRIAHVPEKLCYWRRHDAVVTTSSSNHNPYAKIEKGKWQKWRGAIACSLKGQRSVPVKNRYNSIYDIVTCYLPEGKEKRMVQHVCLCMQKQTAWSLVATGWFYMWLRMSDKTFKNYNVMNKIGNMFFNFTYPSGWWYEYRVHKSL